MNERGVIPEIEDDKEQDGPQADGYGGNGGDRSVCQWFCRRSPSAEGAADHPHITCDVLDSTTYKDGTGEITDGPYYGAWLGYTSMYDTYIDLPAGTPDNHFDPGALNRGQPSVFSPGRHDYSFFVVVNQVRMSKLFWIIDGGFLTINSSSGAPSCGAIQGQGPAAPAITTSPARGLGRTTATLNAVVNPNGAAPSNPPTANPDSYATAEGKPLVVEAPGVLKNDLDPDGDALTATKVGGPSNGALSLQPSGFFLYTPKKDFSGKDSFTYKASDGAAQSPAVTVSITVTPVAKPAPNTAPGIEVLSPARGAKVHDRTPTIRATVRDAQTNLARSNIRLWVDGKRVERFSYDRSTDRLSYTTKKLGYGRHTVLILARDAHGLSASRFWGFRVVKR